MKILIKLCFVVMATALLLMSCSNDNNTPETPKNELDGLVKIKELKNDTHIVELYSASGNLYRGYNDVKLRIKNIGTNEYEKNAIISWLPLMHMTTRTHSCPISEVEKITANGTFYGGYIVFQMNGSAEEPWDIKIDYKIADKSYSVTDFIDVLPAPKRNIEVFNGTDGQRYIVALVEPKSPKVAVNDLTIGVWKMENMMSFPIVDDYTVIIDPRMPSMGNHSSPNNVNAKQLRSDKLYQGKLSLTMTGYWKINLQLADKEGTTLKGEEVTDTNESSSIYFEIEF
ncbi:MAG: hypothetical protein Q4G16_07845 [Cruoricaptor ignavus]|nr:hypothetical protein [Cruoricaptor ignavus]